ncbi:unannotated protein [freshwater metagenome]|uniref:Unannotated protein n=1 Tax=freshwater metagenome TaxID=449393 RepID=A0A6J6FQ48_9ZZZZ
MICMGMGQDNGSHIAKRDVTLKRTQTAWTQINQNIRSAVLYEVTAAGAVLTRVTP